MGVSDGFIATGAYPDGTCADPNGSCKGMWYSSDGLMAPPGNCDCRHGQRVGIRDDAALSGDCCLGGAACSRSTTTGVSTSGPRAAPRSFRWPRNVHGTVATGPLGLVSIGDGQVLVSRDGIDYKVSSIPAQMADPANGAGGSTVVAVGDRTVLVLESRQTSSSSRGPRLSGSARSSRDRSVIAGPVGTAAAPHPEHGQGAGEDRASSADRTSRPRTQR